MLPLVGLYRGARTRLRPLRARARRAHGHLLAAHANAQFEREAAKVPHQLAAPLIVSFTSYPPRFATLALTAKCLLSQSVRPDHVVLWIAEGDLPDLPLDVRRLASSDLCIRTCPDYGPFKKLVPTLQTWPGAFVATADDDVSYPRTWLAELLDGYRRHPHSIPCHRAHTITLTRDGLPRAYRHWRFDSRRRSASPLTFPTGVGGVLYPPQSLHAEVTEVSTFSRLCPRADDAWVYWMGRRAGQTFRRVGARRFVPWPGSQDAALQNENAACGNDRQIANLIHHFGFPPVHTPPASITHTQSAAAAW
jgi:hypothetical protein